jgi:hypothetical protein
MRRAVVVAALAAALSAPVATAVADSTVTVPGLAFPTTDTYLSYFGCADLYQGDNQAPQVRIGKDGTPPAGARSFGLLVPGTGTASGPVHLVESVADTSVAGFSARADAGGDGVAYVWFVTPGLEQGQVWAGRADLSVGPAWQYVDTAAETYAWQLLDAPTGEVVRDGGTTTISDFTAAHGDGPGYLLAGFGCGGEEFSIDALRYGSPGAVTTYDLEGIRVTASMAASASEVPPGTPVTLTGSAVDAAGIPVGAPMVLEAKPAGEGEFRPTGDPVPAASDGLVRTTVRPDTTTTYRWYLPGLGYADESWSAAVTIVVVPPVTEPPEPSPQPTGTPSAQPTDEPSAQPDDEQVVVPPLPTQSPTETPTDQPTEPPTEEPSAAPDPAQPTP